MESPILSILIPTVKNREKMLWDLVAEFLTQCFSLIAGGSPESVKMFFPKPEDAEGVFGYKIGSVFEIIVYQDNKEISVGEKRDRLYRLASGAYSLQWDEDDWIAPDAIQEIVGVLVRQAPEIDVVSFDERVSIDGRIYKSSHNGKYAGWEGEGENVFADGFHFHRTPFFKSVIRTAYCQHIGVADMRYAEDVDFSILIKPLLTKEVHIDKELYYYNHVSSEHNERYGIKESAK